MRTKTSVRTAVRGISGAAAIAIMLWLVLAAPGLVSDRDSTGPRLAREVKR